MDGEGAENVTSGMSTATGAGELAVETVLDQDQRAGALGDADEVASPVAETGTRPR